MIELISEICVEKDPVKQAKLLAPLSSPKVWHYAFRALDTGAIPLPRDGRPYPITMRIRDAAEAVQGLSATLIQFEETQSPAVLRILYMALHLLWPSAWAWIEFLDPLEGRHDAKGIDVFMIALAVPGVLATVLALALEENDPDMVATMKCGPLERFLALWYHDYGVDYADADLASIMRRHDESLYTRTKHVQDVMSDFLLPDCPYFDRTVHVLNELSNGHPERVRRRLLANLARDADSKYLVSDWKMMQTYVQPIMRLHSVKTLYLKPPSARTIQRQTEFLLKYSVAPKTVNRAAFFCSILLAMDAKQPGERILAIALSAGLLPALRNIVANMPRVEEMWVSRSSQVTRTMIAQVRMALRMRRVTKRLVRIKDILLPTKQALVVTASLSKEWGELIRARMYYTSAWTTLKRKRPQFRVCSNSECTLDRPPVKRCICQEAFYCSQRCQREDWHLRHRTRCLGEREETELTLEDRLFLEELTTCYIAKEQPLIKKLLEKPENQAKLTDGWDIELRLRYDEKTPDVHITLEPMPKGGQTLASKGQDSKARAGGLQESCLFQVAELQYAGVLWTSKMNTTALPPFAHTTVERAPFSWLK
ncbi:hypothetical protein BD626DRAFT_397072 [Schizophyllum amplum]|uniref:MYND-type domain-containing protein n=1 Tax=Schizophyllum amplum TaxID=97359 RepID=A0A550CQE8_9AGAR|nr:hypothetical protein BD626DRAFT_397072 [Auriculariopsis ampla]